jgi:CMP/dCMP kinase
VIIRRFEGGLLSGSKEPASIVVTIDGPAGAGKSTVAKLLASSLGFEFLDTGAMYRSVTHAALQQGISLVDTRAIFDLASGLSIELDGSNVRVNGQDVSEAIRSPEVGQSIAAIADNVEVRKLLSQWQRDWAKGRCVVTEGRDQGSEVFDHSPCKIFLVASSEERAKRRQEELAQKGNIIDWQTILEQQNRRDHQDRSRPVGALRKADDAIEFSTDGLTLAEVVEQLEEIVRKQLAGFSWTTPHPPKPHQPVADRQSLPSRESE